MLKTLPRGIPTSKVGLVMVLGATVAPVVLKKLRPVAKSIGKGMIKLGKKLREAGEEPHVGPRVERVKG